MRSVMQYWEPERPLEPNDYDMPVCPVCGEETDTYYKNKDGSVEATDGYGNVTRKNADGTYQYSTDSGNTWHKY